MERALQRFAITGGIGSGKSYVCHLLEKRGISVYDCDEAAKRLMRSDESLQMMLQHLIGGDVCQNGIIQKRVLAAFLLENDAHKQAVNDIVHPAVATDFMLSNLQWLESAILFESGIYAKIPTDMPEKLALSALDVAGAPAQTAKLCKPGDTVLIIGAGGKSGMLCCYEAKKRVGVTGKVIGMTHSPKSTERLQKLGFCDVVFSGNATDPVSTMEKISELTGGKMADITINNVNIPDTEMTSVLCTKNDGIVYFFSMATSFTKAALGAEGVGSDVTMIVGNGYTKGHAEITLQELRENAELRKIFEELYA